MKSLRNIIGNWLLNGSRETNTPSTDDVARIIAGAAATEETQAADQPDPISELSEKLDLLTADAGRWNEYKAASSEYINEFTTELRWHRWTRTIVTVFAGCMVISLLAGLFCAIAYRDSLFGADPGHALTAMIVATVGGSVVVMIAVAKGAFSTMADRNSGLPMPEHMKELYEVGKSFWKG